MRVIVVSSRKQQINVVFMPTFFYVRYRIEECDHKISRIKRIHNFPDAYLTGTSLLSINNKKK